MRVTDHCSWLLLLVLLYCCTSVKAQQGINNLWLGGFEDESPPPWGGVNLDFISGSLSLSTMTREIDFVRTNANISSNDGTLLFCTNGAYIGDALGDTMVNGADLNPSDYTSLYAEGLNIPQGCLILPKPESDGIYFLIHGTIDDFAGQNAAYLYLTTVDMSLNGGLGAVTSKNEVLINDLLNVGKITSVRHANGRDWWVFCHKKDTNEFYRLLLTPEGVQVLGTQAIGIVRYGDLGQVCFSPNGTKFAYYWGDGEDLEIFGFDRCSGLFSTPVHIAIEDQNSQGGVAFSPNSRYLYVPSVEDVYQYDTEASDISASMVHIAQWDGFYSPSPPFATLFDIAQLAPDGKVYISTGNGTLHLHVINNPDMQGFDCNIVQHGIELPRYFANSLPNHPNYHLGPVDGSVFDSLGINVGVAEQQNNASVKAFPNPTNGNFQVTYPAHATVGSLNILDAHGKVVYQHRIPQWSTVHAVQLPEQAPGMYHCRLAWGSEKLTTRIVIQE